LFRLGRRSPWPTGRRAWVVAARALSFRTLLRLGPQRAYRFRTLWYARARLPRAQHRVAHPAPSRSC